MGIRRWSWSYKQVWAPDVGSRKQTRVLKELRVSLVSNLWCSPQLHTMGSHLLPCLGSQGLLFLCMPQASWFLSWVVFLCLDCNPAFHLHSRNWIWVIRLLWPAPLPAEPSPQPSLCAFSIYLNFSFFLLLNIDEPSLASRPILLPSIPFWTHLYFLAFTEGSFVLPPALVSHFPEELASFSGTGSTG